MNKFNKGLPNSGRSLPARRKKVILRLYVIEVAGVQYKRARRAKSRKPEFAKSTTLPSSFDPNTAIGEAGGEREDTDSRQETKCRMLAPYLLLEALGIGDLNDFGTGPEDA